MVTAEAGPGPHNGDESHSGPLEGSPRFCGPGFGKHEVSSDKHWGQSGQAASSLTQRSPGKTSRAHQGCRHGSRPSLNSIVPGRKQGSEAS